METRVDRYTKIIGVDVGTTFTGVSIFTIDLHTLELVNIETVLLDASRINTGNYDLTNRLNFIYNRYLELLQIHDPVAVILEYGFINRFRPGAYGPLSQCRGVLELAVTNMNRFGNNFNNIMYGGISPATVKNGVGAKGGTDKITVKESIKKIPEITKYVNCDLISEDEIDSVAVGYTFIKMVRLNPLILLKA